MILWLHLHYTVFWSRWLENENDMVNTSRGGRRENKFFNRKYD